METIFMNTENSKTNEPDKFSLYLLQRLDLKSLTKHVDLQNLSTCYTWKNVRQQQKKKKNQSNSSNAEGMVKMYQVLKWLKWF